MTTNVYDVWFEPKGATPDTQRHMHHELPADEWPSDLDTAVSAIRARYEADYGRVVSIFYRPNHPNERFPAGRQLYGRRRYE